MSDHSAKAASHRPVFPKRAVITGGMPYGNKSLHFGHIGGVFIHADAFARFLRDRIGSENVLLFRVLIATAPQFWNTIDVWLNLASSPARLKTL